jgi:hypothetical protein
MRTPDFVAARRELDAAQQWLTRLLLDEGADRDTVSEAAALVERLEHVCLKLERWQ